MYVRNGSAFVELKSYGVKKKIHVRAYVGACM